MQRQQKGPTTSRWSGPFRFVGEPGYCWPPVSFSRSAWSASSEASEPASASGLPAAVAEAGGEAEGGSLASDEALQALREKLTGGQQ